MAADYTIRGDTRLDASGINEGLGKISSLAKSGLGVLATAATAAAAAIGGVAVSSVKLASDLTEVQNVVDVTFGDNAAKINDWAEAADTAYGLSTLAAKQYTGTLGAMLKSMGLADDQVLQMSTDMVGLAGDFASFYNLDAADAFEKIRSGISGETEPLKQLGINMSVANLEAFALSQGIDKTYDSMTQAEQATLRYNYLMSVSADAQGDFVRTQDSLANQMRIAQLQVQEMGATIGSALLPMATEGAKALNGMLESLRTGFESGGINGLFERLEEVVGSLTEMVATKAPELASAAVGLLSALTQGVIGAAPALLTAGAQIVTALGSAIVANGPQMLASIVSLFQMLGTAVTTYGPMLMQQGLAFVQQLGQGLIQGIPTFLAQALPLVLQFTSALRSNFGTLVDAGIDLIINLAQGLVNSIPVLLQYVPQIVTNIAGLINDNAPKLLAAGVELLVMLGVGLVQAIPTLVANLPRIIQAIVAVITAFNWLALGSQILTTLGNGIAAMSGGVKTAVTNGMRGAIDYLKSLPKQALKWGKDFIAGLIDGIKSKIKDVVATIGDLVGAIASMIHFSRPDTGPLREYEKWMPDFMDGLALGIDENAPAVVSRIERLADRMADAANLAADAAQAKIATAVSYAPRDDRDDTDTEDDDSTPVPVTQNFTFNYPMQAPDEIAREVRIKSTYGMGGDRE